MNLRQNKSMVSLLLASILMANVAVADNTTSKKEVAGKTNSAITSTVQNEHSEWGVTETEYSRYQSLMKGVRGSVSPSTISPIEVLGIHARTPAEREKYARMWADIMDRDTQQVLAFQVAYNKAWEEKGGKDLIDASKLNINSEKSQPINAVDYIFLTKLQDCPACDKKLSELLNGVTVVKDAKLNVYFADSAESNKGTIRLWALNKNINAEMLRARKITLNHGQNLMSQYGIKDSELPVVFKRLSDGGIERVK